MQIVTWNVNSIRSRLDHVLNFYDAVGPDVICLQETKVLNENFPLEPFEQRDLYCELHGQKSYNGVAILSKHKLEDVVFGFDGEDLNDQTRVITATVNGVRICGAYCPQGSDLSSPKFEFKRNFYKCLTDFVKAQSDGVPFVVCGDYNIAPTEADVDDVAKRSGDVMFTEEEHGWLQALYDLELQDAFRLTSDEAKVFSWWDYRQLAFQMNRGLRIDYHLVNKALAGRVKEVIHYRDERKRPSPSDHIPVGLVLGE